MLINYQTMIPIYNIRQEGEYLEDIIQRKDKPTEVTDVVEMLVRMSLRGECGCETNTGDGVPHDFYREEKTPLLQRQKSEKWNMRTKWKHTIEIWLEATTMSLTNQSQR